MRDALLLATTFLLSVGLTRWLAGGGANYLAVDIPNARSSHSRPTPRGGGVAVAVVSLLGLAAVGGPDTSLWPAVRCLVSGGVLAAGIGLLDDLRNVPLGVRLAGQFLAAGVSLSLIGGLPRFVVLAPALPATWLLHALAAVYLVWMLNLTNFMDGIDGITAVESVTVCFGGALIAGLTAPGNAWVVPSVVGAASLGFLVWNWPPARIFLGDVGSGFLGHTIGVLTLLSGAGEPRRFWAWVILAGVFVADATITLLARALRAEPLHQAHRTHAYQRAAVRVGGHRPVTVVVALINVLWLLPLAVAVATGALGALPGVVIAYVPLSLGAMWIARAEGSGPAQPRSGSLR